MIPHAIRNSWSELLTSISWPTERAKVFAVCEQSSSEIALLAVSCLPSDVSRPACSGSKSMTWQWVNSRATERRGIDATCFCAAPPTVDFHRGFLCRAPGLTQTASPGNPNTKNVSILRIDYPKSEAVLSRVREIATSRSSRDERCQARRLNEEIRNALDDRRCATDSLALGF